METKPPDKNIMTKTDWNSGGYINFFWGVGKTWEAPKKPQDVIGISLIQTFFLRVRGSEASGLPKATAQHALRKSAHRKMKEGGKGEKEDDVILFRHLSATQLLDIWLPLSP